MKPLGILLFIIGIIIFLVIYFVYGGPTVLIAAICLCVGSILEKVGLI